MTEMRADYRWHRPFATRWNDNDVFGHVNNAVYYEAMDTTVTSWLLGEAGFAADGAEGFPVVVSSSCRYVTSGVFPDVFDVGLRADRLGRSSISWGLGIFRESDGELLATGSFVHVVVDREARRPTPVPAPLRTLIESALLVDATSTL